MIHILIPENFNLALFRKAFLCITGICLISTTKKISIWVRLVLVAITSESTDRFTGGTAVIWSVPGNILFQGSPRRKLRYQNHQAWHPATRYPKISNQIKKCKACADRNESTRFLLAGVTLFLIDLLTFSFCWRFDNLCGSHLQSHIQSQDLTMEMASAQVVETSVTNNSPSQDSSHPDDLFQSRYVTPGFKPFSYLKTCRVSKHA